MKCASILGTSGTALNELNTPYGIALDESTGTFYVSEYSGHRIMQYASGASSGTIVAGGNGAGTGSTQLSGPFGIYLDLAKNSLVIANRGANNIVRWILGTNTWTLLVGDSSGLNGASSTLLNGPCSVTLDSIGNMYVADTFNHRIQFFLLGETNGTTIIGTTGVAGSNASLLDTPYALKVDQQYNLYVADTLNHRVQNFSHY